VVICANNAYDVQRRVRLRVGTDWEVSGCHPTFALRHWGKFWHVTVRRNDDLGEIRNTYLSSRSI